MWCSLGIAGAESDEPRRLALSCLWPSLPCFSSAGREGFRSAQSGSSYGNPPANPKLTGSLLELAATSQGSKQLLLGSSSQPFWELLGK